MSPRSQCDLCGAALEPRYAAVRDPQTLERMDILRCAACGLGHTDPQPEDIGRYYGSAYHGGRHGPLERFCMARRMRFVRQVSRAQGRLLDYGCGDGGFLDVARAAGWSVQGVEMKPADARERGLDVVERVEDVSGPFDLITLWHSLEHMRSPRATFDALVPLLKPEGVLMVAVPNAESLQAEVFGGGWFHLDVPRHLFHFTPKALELAFRRVAVEPIARWDLESELDLFGWTQSVLNLIVRTPNVLFDTITRRRTGHAMREIALSLALAPMATVAFAPMLPLGVALGRGAVTIMAGRRARPS